MNQQFIKQITETNKDGESRILTMLRGSGIQLLLLFAVLLSPFFFSSCSDIDCPVTNGVSAKYVLKGDSLHDTLTISAIRDGLTDTVLVNRLVGSKSFQLPMSYAGASDKLRFVFTDTLGHTTVDTLTIAKTSVSHFESVDCQPVFFHTITGATTTGRIVNRIEINNPNVDYDGSKENFHLYISRH